MVDLNILLSFLGWPLLNCNQQAVTKILLALLLSAGVKNIVYFTIGNLAVIAHLYFLIKILSTHHNPEALPFQIFYPQFLLCKIYSP